MLYSIGLMYRWQECDKVGLWIEDWLLLVEDSLLSEVIYYQNMIYIIVFFVFFVYIFILYLVKYVFLCIVGKN